MLEYERVVLKSEDYSTIVDILLYVNGLTLQCKARVYVTTDQFHGLFAKFKLRS